MRKYSILLGVLFILNFLTVEAQELPQSSLEIKPYAGISLPQSNFGDFANSGFNVGVALDKYFGKRFGLGLDANFQSFGFNNPYSFELLSPTSLSSSSDGQWSSFSFLLGPTYKIGSSKFNAEVYAKGGLLSVSPPNQTVNYSIGDNQNLPVFSLSNDNVTGFGLNTGIRFNYKISNRLSIFINPQYQYSGQQVEYFHRPITQEVADNPDLLIQDAGELCYIRPNTLGINGGITINLNKTKKDNQVEESQYLEENYCKSTRLKFPIDNQKFIKHEKNIPEFSWDNPSEEVEYYVLNVYKNDKRIIKIKTKNSSISDKKELIKIYKASSGVENRFTWNITTHYKSCTKQDSENRTFTYNRSGNNIGLNVNKVECGDPWYDNAGNVNYTAELNFNNDIGNSSNWFITGINLVETSQPFSVTDLYFMMGGTKTYLSPLSLNLVPGSNVTYLLDFSVPIGHTSHTFETIGTLGNGSGNVSALHSLPPCLCNICDDWDIQSRGKGFNTLGTAYWGGSLFTAGIDLRVLNSRAIKEVSAEIISVEHDVNDPQCYTCTKAHKQMGLFVNSGPIPRVLSNEAWANTRRGILTQPPGPQPPDDFSNEIKWTAQNSSGVNLSYFQRFLMHISLPAISDLSCCHDKFKVCIKFTITDIDCNTCEKIICFEYDKTQSGNNGGPGNVGGINTGQAVNSGIGNYQIPSN